MVTDQASPATPDVIQQQAGKLLSHVGGFVAHRTVEMGLRHGLIDAVARNSEGVTPARLAAETSLDPFYVEVWCRAAVGAEVLDTAGDGAYRLAPGMDQLLLNPDSPGWMGGVFQIMVQPEIFDHFSAKLPSGDRLWWDAVSSDFIDRVSLTSRPFYTRLLEGGFDRVPGLVARLSSGARVAELACGTGRGLVRIAAAYPQSTFVAVDGDSHSLDTARAVLQDGGVLNRVSLVLSTLEDWRAADEFDAVLINVSMHECRDIDRVTDNVREALRPGGLFVISDFPFPEDAQGLRTPAARVMSGIQFFEALIGDQLLPTAYYVELLRRHGFRDVEGVDLTPVHNVIYGAK